MSDIVVTIMIKDEETCICQTLEPLLISGFINYLIYDTGSIDNTIDVTRKYLDGKVNFIIKEDTYSEFDYSIARNKMLNYARNLFGNYCRFALSLDAEWYLTNGKEIIKFLSNIAKPEETYCVNIISDIMIYSQHRVFNLNEFTQYEGFIHEAPNTSSKSKLPESIYFTWNPNRKGIEKSRKRWYTDLAKILPHYHNNKNTRTVFYLAQTYDCLTDNENAIRYYKERATMIGPGVEEEVFMSFYRIGKLYESTNNWDEAFKYYMMAYQCRKQRVEPLIRIAGHYLDSHIKYMFAKQACIVPFPKDDFLFVEKQLYDYDRWNQLAIGAWYMEEWEEGYDAVNRAISAKGQLEHLITNRNLFETKVKNIKTISSINKTKKEEEIVKSSLDLKILVLIKYNLEFYKIQSEYLTKNNILHFFYTERNQNREFLLENDILYISNNSEMKDLDITFKAFKYVYDNIFFDYIIKTTSSTIISYDILKDNLSKTSIDYGGPLYYSSNSSGLII